jgi:hypothetical protein
MTILIAPPTYSMVTGNARGDGPILVVDTPLYVGDEIVRRNLTGRIATPMDWADYLVWKTDAGLKPLVYSHVHLTERETWKDYESIFRGDELWLHVLQNHGMRYVLVSRKRYPQLAGRVLQESRGQTPRVEILYQDQRCLLAELNLSQAAPAKAQPAPAANPGTGG